MKKGWKIFWIVCASVFGVGVVLCIAGFAVGVSNREVRAAFRNGFEKFGIHSDSVITDYETHTEMAVERTEDEGDIFQGIRNLDVEVASMSFQIVGSDRDDLRLVKDVSSECKEHLQIYQEGDTLKIEMEERHRNKYYEGALILYVPQGMVFDSAEFSVGAASMEIEELHAKELEMEVGAGSITADIVEAEEMSLTCGMGSIEMTVGGRQEDYNYNLEVGMGRVDLEENEFGGVAMEKNINNNAAKNVDIECGMGSITLDFE